MAKRKNTVDHVVMGGDGFRCLNCGVEQALTYPVSMNVLAGAGKGFEKDHRACKPSERGAARFRYQSPTEWLDSWDTGLSSKTIWSVMTGRSPGWGVFGPTTPSDPGDFGRCYRLLKAMPPSWRERLPEVAARYPAWSRLVERWADLERLYEEEEPTGRAPKLYALMKELLEPAPASAASGEAP